ncbi:MAG TPA: VWA domain-containing protein [Nocardioides sp.]|nr:VWA domain-containing protein [Nocardioides sp.]
MTSLLAGVDRATFATALGDRLRRAGVPVTVRSMTTFVDGLASRFPVTRDELYWAARLTLVARHDELADFDRVFDAAFREAVLPLDPNARRQSPEVPPSADEALASVALPAAGDETSSGLPWHTLPRTDTSEPDEPVGRPLPDPLPSAVARVADTPLDELDPLELALLERWLAASADRWPTRRSRRTRVHVSGRRLALRETMAASRRTGWEPVELRYRRQVRRPLTVTLLVDVSQSMQAWSSAYLHLMRAFARTRRAETFAFSTSLTRLTPALSHRSAAVAVAQASAEVVDRYGGTHLASSLAELLASRHGSAVRGGVLVIASDGWDADPPELMAATMAKAARRARRVVWLNPRASAEGFEPLVGSMAAALPYCDAFLPADRLRALPAVLDAIAGADGRRR